MPNFFLDIVILIRKLQIISHKDGGDMITQKDLRSRAAIGYYVSNHNMWLTRIIARKQVEMAADWIMGFSVLDSGGDRRWSLAPGWRLIVAYPCGWLWKVIEALYWSNNQRRENIRIHADFDIDAVIPSSMEVEHEETLFPGLFKWRVYVANYRR